MARLGSPSSDLDDAQRAAVDFADAMMADPAGIDTDLRDRLHRHFSPEQITELALDVMKWSYQKFAVALGLDRPIAAENSTTDAAAMIAKSACENSATGERTS